MHTRPHLLPLALLVLSTTACVAPRPAAESDQGDPPATEQPGTMRPAFAVSPHTQRFIEYVRTEAAEAGSLHYIPSATTVQRFGLRQRDGIHFFHGLAMTTSAFDPATVSDLGGTVGNTANGMSTIAVPVHRLEEFLRIPGIIHFALSESTHTN